MSRLALFLLGSPRIEVDGQPIEVERRKALALLAYLAMTGRSQRRESLAALFWPEYEPARSYAYLRRTLWEINQALGREWLAGDRDAVGLAEPGQMWVDVAEFRGRVQTARGQAQQRGAAQACVDLLAGAVALYRGDFLAGFTLRDSPAFDDWQLFQAETLRREAGEALAMLARLHGQHGEVDAGLAAARRWLELDPWHEPAHRALMTLYVQAGQRAEALRQYEKCARVLRAELGAAPEPETVALYERIRAGVLTARPEQSQDEGRAWRGGAELGPAARAGGGTGAAAPLRYLPLQTDALVGRAAEVAAVGQLLSDPNGRLVTITGPGGMGKTRLAIEVAGQNAASFAGGVVFVPLAAVNRADSILPAIATALRIPVQRQDVHDQVVRFLRPQPMLLVLDNFEQLLTSPAAAERITDLLTDAPGLRLLITSRERLNLQAEWVYPLQSLPFPAADDADVSWPAVQLFVQSARHARADFTLSPSDLPCVARICRLVEGMPLAVELAARWVRALSCEDIAAEIDNKIAFLGTSVRDVPERHRSLVTVFDHSWGLLGNEERTVFRRLSVFRGGFTREAAEHVAGASLLDLASLIDKSLLQGSPGRYEMHELLRQYAGAKLAQSGEEDQVRTRHLQYFLALCEAASFGAHTAQQQAWFARMGVERSNVRAALAWALESNATESALRFGAPLLDFWFYWGSMDEGRAWMEAALQQASGETNVVIRGAALAVAGHLDFLSRAAARGLARLEESVRLLREAGAGCELAMALNALGIDVEWGHGDFARARALQEEAASLYRQSSDDWGQAVALNCLAGALLGLGQTDAAHDRFQESLAVFSRLGDRVFLSWPLLGLGAIALRRGDLDSAETYYGRTVALGRETGNQGEMAWALSILGHVALGRSEYDLAADRYRQAMPAATSRAGTQALHGCLMGLAAVAHVRGQFPRAARLIGAAHALAASSGMAVGSAGSDLAERAIEPVRRVLGEAQFATLEAEGKAMPLDEAVAYAAADLD